MGWGGGGGKGLGDLVIGGSMRECVGMHECVDCPPTHLQVFDLDLTFLGCTLQLIDTVRLLQQVPLIAKEGSGAQVGKALLCTLNLLSGQAQLSLCSR